MISSVDFVHTSGRAAWRDFAAAHPHAAIYCWRGGLRSQIAQRWLAESGVVLPRIVGGFKALRQFCLDMLERSVARDFVLVGGRTGSGKTAVVQALANHVDLEALANHRGSAFGGHPTPQPPPVAFENALAVALLKLDPHAPTAIEDEGRSIGRLAVPQAVYDAMQRAPIVVLECRGRHAPTTSTKSTLSRRSVHASVCRQRWRVSNAAWAARATSMLPH